MMVLMFGGRQQLCCSRRCIGEGEQHNMRPFGSQNRRICRAMDGQGNLASIPMIPEGLKQPAVDITLRQGTDDPLSLTQG